MERTATINRLRGCYLALPTLFKDDLSLNLAGMRRHVRFLIDHGLHEGNAVLLVNGANGEFPMLTLEERKETAEAVVGEANGRIAVIVGAQTSSTREAIRIAQHAQDIGAAALQVSPPYYFTPTDDDVYEYVAAIARAAPHVGIVFYTAYWLGYKPALAMLDRLAEIPQVACVKWGSSDLLGIQEGTACYELSSFGPHRPASFRNRPRHGGAGARLRRPGCGRASAAAGGTRRTAAQPGARPRR
jgi:4-hydroxy-tetrahydrodipicolinate synthase